MITWIQQTFQQHFKVVFTLLLTVVIISFVFTIGAAPGIGGAERGAQKREFFGRNLASEEDQKRVYGDASLSIFVQSGMAQVDQSQLSQYALVRHAAIALADKLGIPAPTPRELEEHIKTMQRFAGDNGQFDGKKYADFRDNFKKEARVTAADLTRVLADEVRLEKVQKLLGGPGYVLPAEVKKQLATAESTWTVSVASIDYASYNPNLRPSEEELTKFFDDNAFRYEIPQQVVLSYVDFPASAYVNQINVTEPEVRALYDSNPARFPKPDAPAPSATPQVVANPAADYGVVRPLVESTLKLERAQRLAAKAASDFAYSLFERKISPASAELNSLLAAQKLTLKELPPFGSDSVPSALGGNPEVANAAFRLNKSRPVSDALRTDTGSVVLFWKDTVPSRKPAFAEVRAKVATDFAEEEKRKRFTELGGTLKAQIAMRVKNGEAFDKAAEAVASANSVKVEVKNVPSFTLRERPQDLDFAVLNAVQNLNKGDISDMVRSQGDKGLLVYAADKKTPELADNNPQYAATRAQLAQMSTMRNGGDYLQELVREELARITPTAQ